MMGIRTIFNSIAKQFVVRRCTVQFDKNSQISWMKIKGYGGGTLTIGTQSIIHCQIDFDSTNGLVEIGDRTFIGASHLVCHSNISIGDDVLMSWGVTIVDHNSHALEWKHRQNDVADWMAGQKNWDHVHIAPVHIGDKAWIGFGASVLKGVTIGEGAIIGAQSVVTRDVPPYTIVAGNPAKIIRELTQDERASSPTNHQSS